jgi:DNA-binding transcriptional LysR family regulator
MNIEPNDLLLFARVADEGSFSRAAARVGLPKSTLSRRIAALEAQLGERLLLRTTRKLTVTDFGHSVLEHARQVAAEVEAAAQLAQHRQIEPSGRLRVSMPADFANVVLGLALAEFIEKHPAITLELDLTPRRVDLVGENFDLALRMGQAGRRCHAAARRIASFSVGLYAAPGYLERHGMPSEPEALMEHDALLLLQRDGDPEPWALSRDESRWEGMPPGRVVANSPELLTRLACAVPASQRATIHFAMPSWTAASWCRYWRTGPCIRAGLGGVPGRRSCRPARGCSWTCCRRNSRARSASATRPALQERKRGRRSP